MHARHTIGSMDLHAVKPSFQGVLSGLAKQTDILLDLICGERTRRRFALHCNVGAGDIWVVSLLFQDLWQSLSTRCPKLQINVRLFVVDRLCDLCERSERIVGRMVAILTRFHASTCSLFHIPGTFLYPPASGAINVASVMSNVPGVFARCS